MTEEPSFTDQESEIAEDARREKLLIPKALVAIVVINLVVGARELFLR
jgi:hypothetical protein